jgi:hypothetical protein
MQQSLHVAGLKICQWVRGHAKAFGGVAAERNLSYDARLKRQNRTYPRMPSQLFAARLAFAALVLAAAIGSAAVGGVRLHILALRDGLTLMIPATVLGVAALAAALLWLRGAVKYNNGTGKRLGLIALIGALAFLYPPLSQAWYGLTLPAIHDFPSDPDDPPAFVALAKVASENSRAFDGARRIRYKGEQQSVAYVLHEEYPRLTKPHAGILTSPQKAFWRSFEIVKALGWTIVDADSAALRIEATDTSLWFGQIHDIVIRVRPAGAIGSRIDIRSESREGVIDHGRNAARLTRFFARLRV